MVIALPSRNQNGLRKLTQSKNYLKILGQLGTLALPVGQFSKITKNVQFRKTDKIKYQIMNTTNRFKSLRPFGSYRQEKIKIHKICISEFKGFVDILELQFCRYQVYDPGHGTNLVFLLVASVHDRTGKRTTRWSTRL